MGVQSIVKPLVIANWKMNGDEGFNAKLMVGITNRLDEYFGVDVVVCSPFPYLMPLASLLSSLNGRIGLGAQNVSEHASGAYTGEVSAVMLRDVGCGYGLVGHSERRSLFAETDRQVALKCEALLQANIVPVLCVGETLEARKANSTSAIVSSQLRAVLEHCDKTLLKRLVVAYEPVWAIGTGETASPSQVQAVHSEIRSLISDLLGVETARAMPILYGGSVKPSNAAELFAQQDVDGGLIGGASLKADDFVAICVHASARLS